MIATKRIVIGLLVSLAAGAVVTAQEFRVKSVGSVRHGADTQVTVVFSKPVDPTTGTAPGNYTFSGGIQVTGASLMTGLPAADLQDVIENPAPFGRVHDNECVVLTVTGLAVEQAASVTIQNVKSADGATLAPTTINFKDSGYAWVDVGIHPIPGKVIAIGDKGFDIYSSGQTQWAAHDQVTFVYKEVTGDFEYTARAEFQDFSSRWARAGIMAREVLNAGEDAATQATTASRYVDIHANPARCWNDADSPVGLVPANNLYESHYRNGGILQGTERGTDSSSGGTPGYPNAWLRIARTGTTFTTYSSNDGENWSLLATRDFSAVDPALSTKLYVGPAFSPEIGNINAANPDDAHNRLFLYQVRFGAIPVPRLTAFEPNPVGFRLEITDGETAVNTATLKLKLNGTAITAAVNKNGAVTTARYSQSDAFPVGSTNTVDIEFQDSAGTTVTTKQIFVAEYISVPADYATASPATTPGMTANVYQIDFVRTGIDENSLGSSEQQLARGFIDPATGEPYANVAAGASFEVSTVNWDQYGSDIDGTPEDGPDNFNSMRPESNPVPNESIPGIPGSGSDPRPGADNGQPDNNIAVEVLTYLHLTKGVHRMGVNSDDGFRVSVAPGAPDVFGLTLGVFDGGRGPADTTFDFYINADGYYPFRLIWWEGVGGADVEWFSVDVETGEKTLINGTGTKAIKAYRNGAGRAYVKRLLPANGFTAADVRPTITAELVDGRTQVVDGSVKLILDGQEVPATVVNGPTTTVTYTVPTELVQGTTHTGSLLWTESTPTPTAWKHDFTFTVKTAGVADFPANSFWIEVEDFDFDRGQSLEIASTMPYEGGAYADLLGQGYGGAVHNIDYHRASVGPLNGTALGGYVYRTDIPGWIDEATLQTDYFVPMGVAPGGVYSERPGDPVFTIMTSYKFGWSGGGNWYNYTRTLPAGTYTAYLAASHWNDTDPPAVGQIDSTLSKVVAGVGTPNQTVELLGTFLAAGNGTRNSLTPLKAADGNPALFKASGKTTLRFTVNAGDADWIALVPVANAPPQVKKATPANDAIVNLNAKLEFEIEDFSAKVVANSLKLELDGTDVTSAAVVNKSGDLTTVTYTPPALFAPASAHSYKLSFTDDKGGKQDVAASFTTYPVGAPGMFVIEAEDYNYEGGKHVAAASQMPYPGGAYNGLAAVLDVDYSNADADDSDIYRPDKAPNNVNMYNNLTGRLGQSRGLWDVTVNYSIGWAGAPDWGNYTRTFPPGNYNVYAALSHGNADPGLLAGSLALVTGANSTDQTLQPLGVFNAAGTGGWGRNELVPLIDTATNGIVQVVPLGGEQTLRYSIGSGDFDYLVFVPASDLPAPRFSSLRKNANGTITVEWTGGGTLQFAPTILGPWQAVPGATSPFTFTPEASAGFGRIVR